MKILFPRFFRKPQLNHALNRFLIIVFLIIAITSGAFGQEDKCSRPKVAVLFTEFWNDAVDLLNKKGISQSKASWKHQIQGKVLEELRMASPGTDFITAESSGTLEDCDYIFSYIITVIGAGEDIEHTGLLWSEYTAFFMLSKLVQNSKCGGQNWIVDVEVTAKYEDLFQTIEHNIHGYGDIGKRIEEIERERRVPPRGPEMKTSQNRPYVSPLEDRRSLDIKIDVTNCWGEPVFKENAGQRVELPAMTERGEISPCKSFHQECISGSNTVILKIIRPVGACATYTLKRGLEPGIERVEIKTCGLDKEIIHEEEVRIHGLDLKITPQRKVICAREKTEVLIELSEIDPDGNKTPIPSRKIKLWKEGLVDGSVKPAEKEVTTDDKGQVKLTYRAGKHDSGLVLRAEFQPKGFADSLKDLATVGLCGLQWTGTLTMEQKYTFSCEATRPTGRGTQTLKQFDLRKQTATIALKIDEIELEQDVGDVIQGSEIKLTGTFREMISETNDLTSVEGDYWSHDRNTIRGSTTCEAEKGGLAISFTKTGSADMDELRSLMKEMRSTTDSKRLKEIMEKINAQMNEKGKDGSTSLKIIVQYGPECPYAVTLNQFKETRDPEKGHQIVANDTHNQNTNAVGVQFAFPGKLEQQQGKPDRIFGRFSGIVRRDDFKKVWGCPQSIIFQSITLELSRDRKRGH